MENSAQRGLEGMIGSLVKGISVNVTRALNYNEELLFLAITSEESYVHPLRNWYGC